MSGHEPNKEEPEDARCEAPSGEELNGDLERWLSRLRGAASDSGAGSTEELFADRRREAELEDARERSYRERLTGSAELTSVNVPDDAGVYADRLATILLRIPERWGRRVRVDAGWYPLICELDAQLNDLFPDYVLRQVKQKMGMLNYNWEEPSDARFDDPTDPRPALGWSEEYERAITSWRKRQASYREREGLEGARTDLQQRLVKANTLVSAAEERSITICERCGAPGEPSHSDAEAPWTLILCDSCRAVPVDGLTYLANPIWAKKYGRPAEPVNPYRTGQPQT